MGKIKEKKFVPGATMIMQFSEEGITFEIKPRGKKKTVLLTWGTLKMISNKKEWKKVADIHLTD